MADAKLSALTTASGLALTDLIYVVLDPSGTPVSRKSALSDILTLFLANTDADDIDDAGTTNKFATAAEKAKLAYLTVTGAIDLDTVKTKVNYLTVTGAVDLDSINTRVAELDAAVILQGTWDASSGSFPGSGSAQAGDSWIVSVGGTVDGVVFAADDRIIAIIDNASTSTFASNWHKADYTDLVQSVAGLTGAISAANLIAALNLEVGVDVQAYNANLTTWAGKTAPSGTVVGTSDTQTLSAKTLTEPTIDGAIVEDIYTITDGAGFAIDPANGSIQKVTLGAGRTPTVSGWAAGQSVTLLVDDGSAYAITWTTINPTWMTGSGSAPTLKTSGWTSIIIFYDGTTYYAWTAGDTG